MIFRKQSVSTSIIFNFVIFSIIIITVCFLSSYIIVSNKLFNLLKEKAEITAKSLSEIYAGFVTLNETEEISRSINSLLKTDKDIISLSVYDNEGKCLSTSIQSNIDRYFTINQVEKLTFLETMSNLEILCPIVYFDKKIGVLKIIYTKKRIFYTIFQVIFMIIGFSLLAIMLGSFYYYYSVRNDIISPIDILRRVAFGDFTIDLEKMGKKAKNEIYELIMNFSTMVRDLRNLILRVGEQSDIVSNYSINFSQISKQVVNNMEQLTDIVRQVYNSIFKILNIVKTMNNLLLNVDNMSKEGVKMMENLLKSIYVLDEAIATTQRSIQLLTDKTAAINEIISIITHIAEQTNLLSLNAAIEAARAGEAGKGFAVVADEIRNLAESSAQQAQKIKQIVNEVTSGISSSFEVTKKGVNETKVTKELVQKANDIFFKIASSITEAAKQSEQISYETSNNSSLVKEGSVKIETQLAAVEEIASSSNKLLESAEILKKLVMQFKI